MHPELKAHPEYFQKEIVQLADNVYQAFGFAASNVYMFVGDDGVIIVASAIAPIEMAEPIVMPSFDEPKKTAKSAAPSIKTKKELDARSTEPKPDPKPDPKRRSTGKSIDNDDPRLF